MLLVHVLVDYFMFVLLCTSFNIPWSKFGTKWICWAYYSWTCLCTFGNDIISVIICPFTSINFRICLSISITIKISYPIIINYNLNVISLLNYKTRSFKIKILRFIKSFYFLRKIDQRLRIKTSKVSRDFYEK